MRFILLMFIECILTCNICAQSTAISKKLTITKSKEGVFQSESIEPPLLDIVPNSVKFVDMDGNNRIDANEECELHFKVKNSGKGDGKDCKVTISATGNLRGLKYAGKNLPDIPAGESIEVQIPINADMTTEDGQVNFLVSIEESHGLGSNPLTLSIDTHSFIAPLIQVADYAVTSEQGTTINKRIPFDLQVLVQNVHSGIANDIRMSIELPENVILMEGSKNMQLGTLNGGDIASVNYSLIVNNDYAQSTIPITFKLKEGYGKYAEK